MSDEDRSADDDVDKTPFDFIGPEGVAKIALRFYEIMARDEPALTALHACDDTGQVTRDTQEKFALFLIGWLGGPNVYVQQHGHPRLRMRHNHIKIDKSMRDAWLRCMASALDELALEKPLRAFLDERFYVMANHLINA